MNSKIYEKNGYEHNLDFLIIVHESCASTRSAHTYLIFEVNSFPSQCDNDVFTFFFLLFFSFWGWEQFICSVLSCLPSTVLGYITINTCNHEVEVVWCGVATVNNLVPYLSIYFCRSCPVSRQPRLIFIHQLYPTHNSEFLSIPPS